MIFNSFFVQFATVPVDSLIAAVEKAGYEASPTAPDKDRYGEREAHARKTLVQLLVFGALAVPTIILAMSMDIAGMHINNDPKLHGWIVLLLATPIQLGLGWRFFQGAWISLRHLNPNMDVLVALGTSVAYVYSAWVVITNSMNHMFFDVSAAVLVFITMGKYFEETSKGAASSAIRSLLNLGAKTATVLRGGVETEVPVEQIRPGDTFVVRPGQLIPVDGVVPEGHSTVDESMLAPASRSRWSGSPATTSWVAQSTRTVSSTRKPRPSEMKRCFAGWRGWLKTPWGPRRRSRSSSTALRFRKRLD